MDPSVLTVYQCPYQKIRLGKDNDGGYIIAEIPNTHYEILLAGGIHTDMSFEEDFVKKYHVKCLAYDGTIQALPHEHPTIEFVRKNIGHLNTDQMTNLHSILDAHQNIFVKMDIEGGEIPWLQSLEEEHLQKFDQLVMEFHCPFFAPHMKVFQKLNQHHYLIHFHGNNCCGTRIHRGVRIPNIFECTYLHKKFFTEPPSLNTETIPGPLDMKNTMKDEICIDYPPFVFPSI